VLAAMESIGLCRYVLLRSSDSEGIHLYYPLPKRIWTFGLACAIKFALLDHCIELNSGIVESFPNTKPYGEKGKYTLYNGLRLPLQTGSYLLDDDFQPESDSVEDLLSAFDWAAQGQDTKQLERALATAYPRQKLTTYSVVNSGRAELWRQHLEERWTQGWTGFGQTNALLKDIAVYGRVWLGLESLALVDYTATTATSAPGYDQFCRHQKEIWHRAADWSKCVESYYWVYGSEPNRKGTYASHFHRDLDNDCPHCTHHENNIVDFPNNDLRSIQATERIKSAVAHLEESNSLPAAATARSHAIIAAAKQLTGCGISQTTLHKPKYLALWHPDHYQPRAKECVIDLAEPITAISSSADLPQTNPNAESAKTLLPAPVKDESENYTSDPYMKGLCVLSGTSVQQDGSCPAVSSRGESEGGDVPLTVPVENPPSRAAAPEGTALNPLQKIATIDSAADSVPPATTNTRDPKYTNTLDPKLSRRTKIRLEAISKAKKAVRIQVLEKQIFTKQERERLETIAKMRFFWESGEPVLMDEVRSWALSNPNALPYALPLNKCVGSDAAALNGVRADTNAEIADTNNADINAGISSKPTALEYCHRERESSLNNAGDTDSTRGEIQDFLSQASAPEEIELAADLLDYLQAPTSADLEPPSD
jgi:hypothetical protein